MLSYIWPRSSKGGGAAVVPPRGFQLNPPHPAKDGWRVGLFCTSAVPGGFWLCQGRCAFRRSIFLASKIALLAAKIAILGSKMHFFSLPNRFSAALGLQLRIFMGLGSILGGFWWPRAWKSSLFRGKNQCFWAASICTARRRGS